MYIDSYNSKKIFLKHLNVSLPGTLMTPNTATITKFSFLHFKNDIKYIWKLINGTLCRQ